jgi:hypothetical protein
MKLKNLMLIGAIGARALMWLNSNLRAVRGQRVRRAKHSRARPPRHDAPIPADMVFTKWLADAHRAHVLHDLALAGKSYRPQLFAREIT